MEIIGLTTIFTGCLLLAVYLYFKKCYQYWEKRNVPYEKPKFIFGSFLDIIFGKIPLGRYFGNLYKKFDSPYFGVFILNHPVLVLKDPEIIKQVLVKDFDSFGGKMLFNDDKYDPIFCNSLMGMNFEKWKTFRPKVSPIFTSGKIKMMLHLINKCGEYLVEYLNEVKGQKVNVQRIIENFNANVVSSCIFGIDCNCFETHNEIYKYYGSRLLPGSGLGVIKIYSYHFIHWFIKIFKYPFLRVKPAIFFRKVFADTIQHRRTKGQRRNDLLDILLDLEKEELPDSPLKIDEKIMLGQAIGFFLAGYDTSNIITSLTIHEITINPTIQTGLRKEINDVLEKFGVITLEALQSMKYANMVISETLRKYPVVNFIQRKCVKDCVITETGLKIEKGTNIIIPNYGLHFDDKYFPYPDKYDPERFSDENKDNINPYVYLPFSAGPRNCIGQRFARISIKIALINFLKNFKIERNSNTKEKLTFKTEHVNRAADDIEVTFVPI